jgi:hypothetical protein
MKARRRRLTPSKKATALLIVAITLLFSLPANSYACACCADDGEWNEGKAKIDDSTLAAINVLKPSPKASLYTTDAFPDGTTGITEATMESYGVSLSRDGRKWTLVLTDNKGRRGTLVFSVPFAATFLNADIHDGLKGGAGGPLLYKELRLEGKVWGNGIFAKGITADAKFRLVLQGRGNRCPSAEDFKNWNLHISGPKADYSFYGSFARPANQ